MNFKLKAKILLTGTIKVGVGPQDETGSIYAEGTRQVVKVAMTDIIISIVIEETIIIEIDIELGSEMTTEIEDVGIAVIVMTQPDRTDIRKKRSLNPQLN